MKSDRVPVQMNKKVYDRFKALSDVQGIPIAKLFNEACDDWFDCVGETRLEQLQTILVRGRNIIAFEHHSLNAVIPDENILGIIPDEVPPLVSQDILKTFN